MCRPRARPTPISLEGLSCMHARVFLRASASGSRCAPQASDLRLFFRSRRPAAGLERWGRHRPRPSSAARSPTQRCAFCHLRHICCSAESETVRRCAAAKVDGHRDACPNHITITACLFHVSQPANTGLAMTPRLTAMLCAHCCVRIAVCVERGRERLVRDAAGSCGSGVHQRGGRPSPDHAHGPAKRAGAAAGD